MKREYKDLGILSKDSQLTVFDDTLQKYVMLIPTTNMPETASAPATVEKTVLTEHSVTEVEGLQTNSQKTYNFNYHRDNINRVRKFLGKVLPLMEVNPDYTGEKYTGSIKLGRNAVEVNGIVQGSLYVTVNSADEIPVEDVRDFIAPTAVITTPLNDITIAGTGTYTLTLEATPENATFTAVSSANTVATAKIQDNVLTITGVATGYAKVTITTSKTGEASSERSILVEVVSAE